MALVPCYDSHCSRMISDKALACPQCGAPAGGKRDDGFYRFYRGDGTTLDRELYWKDGVINGPYREFHFNGQLKYEGTYKPSESGDSLVEDGERRFYPEDDGQLRMIQTFKDGKQHGPSWSYRENGQLATKVWFKDDEHHGPYEWYDEQGELGTKGTFNMGEKCGEWFEEGETVTYDPCLSN